MRSVRQWSLLAIAFFIVLPTFADDSALVDYNRDIRPILSDVCYKCNKAGSLKQNCSQEMDRGSGPTFLRSFTIRGAG